MTPEERLAQLGFVAPRRADARRQLRAVQARRRHAYLSGQGPRRADGSYYVGEVGGT